MDQIAAFARLAAMGEDIAELEEAAERIRTSTQDEDALAVVDACLRGARERIASTTQLADLRERVAAAQQLAHMGDYDWHIASDTNTWSDELYRIYGTEPQSFNASYERFLSFIHPEDREHVQRVHQEAYATGEPYHMIERIVRPDGEIRYLESNGQVIMDSDGIPARMRGTCVDVTDLHRAELRLADETMARRQALEINDSVVQGLTSALLALERGMTAEAARYARATMRSARGMMHDLLEGALDDVLAPGALVRSHAATLPPDPAEAGPPAHETDTEDAIDEVRIMIVDDAPDVRMMLRLTLLHEPRFAVIGEASDGVAAVDMAGRLHPDLILLDLAMPKMDGLQALPMLREVAPDARVIVLSGFDAQQMAEQALRDGAHAYLEKGVAVEELLDAVDDVLHHVTS